MIEGELRHGLEFSFFDLDEMDVKVFCRSRKLIFLGCCESWTYMNAKCVQLLGVADRPEHVSINYRIPRSTFATLSQLSTWDDQLLTCVNQLLQKVTRLSTF